MTAPTEGSAIQRQASARSRRMPTTTAAPTEWLTLQLRASVISLRVPTEGSAQKCNKSDIDIAEYNKPLHASDVDCAKGKVFDTGSGKYNKPPCASYDKVPTAGFAIERLASAIGSRVPATTVAPRGRLAPLRRASK